MLGSTTVGEGQGFGKQGAMVGLHRRAPTHLLGRKAAAEKLGLAPHVPGCFTEPTGGGQATAYIYFEPVMLVKREAQPSCIKGCNLDP